MSKYKTWTHEEDLVLISQIGQAGMSKGVKLAAKELGRSEGSCISRYYRSLKIEGTEEYPPLDETDTITIKIVEKKSIWQRFIDLFKKKN